jgi:hypothetical protein
MLIVELYTLVFSHDQSNRLLLLSVIDSTDAVKLGRGNQAQPIESGLTLLLRLTLAADQQRLAMLDRAMLSHASLLHLPENKQMGL